MKIYQQIIFIIMLMVIIYIIFLTKNSKLTKPNVIPNVVSVIPLNIFQTWDTKKLPPKMAECVESIKECNPEFKYYLYDDNECREFIKINFDAEVLYSYDALVPGAFKADLWRYCILYKLGGIYLDIKYKCVNGFKFITLTDKEYFVKDRYEVLNRLAIYNALMICKAGNEICLKCINKVVENVRLRYYGSSALQITGPLMMIEFFTPNEKRELNDLYHYDKDGYYYIVYKDHKILTVYNEYRNEQLKFEKNKHYSVMWDEKTVYV
jgi:mannosyltransferase OCH1-like enzyme